MADYLALTSSNSVTLLSDVEATAEDFHLPYGVGEVLRRRGTLLQVPRWTQWVRRKRADDTGLTSLTLFFYAG